MNRCVCATTTRRHLFCAFTYTLHLKGRGLQLQAAHQAACVLTPWRCIAGWSCCAQARSALATSRLRLARFLRISKLKASMVEDMMAQEDVSSFDGYLSAPGQQQQQQTAAVLGGSSSWPNMAAGGDNSASVSRRSTGTLLTGTGGSTGALPGAGVLGSRRPSQAGEQPLAPAAAAAAAGGSLPGLDTLLPPSGARHARSASDLSSGWPLTQAPTEYVVPDPRMQLLLPRPPPDATTASQQGALPPGSARASSTGAAAAAAHRGSFDVPRQRGLASGHSRSRSMGYDLQQQLGDVEVGPPLYPTSAGASTSAGDMLHGSGQAAHDQLQQQLQPPLQHRRLSSWPSRQQQQQQPAPPPSRIPPTQVFSSWLYGSQSLPAPARAAVPAPLRAGQYYLQPQTHAHPPPTEQPCSTGGGDRSRPGLLLGAWQWVCTTAARVLSDGSDGWEAGLCYVLFVAAFALDSSVMTLVYLASMLMVPLLAQQPVKLYWKAVLVYTEVSTDTH